MIDQNQKDEINVDGWLVTDLPVHYTENDYDEARAEIVKQAENTPGLSALFEYGYIPFEGISDMDFWAIFPDDSEKMYLATEPRLSDKTKHLMMHQAALITEKNYRKMLYLDPWTMNIWPHGHRLLYKAKHNNREMNFENLVFSKEEREILSIAYIEECMVSVYPTLPLYAKKELRVRYILEDIKNCVYIQREIATLTGKQINPTFTSEFEKLRSNWFILDQKDASRKLIKLFGEALIIIFEAAFVLAEYISKRSERMNVIDLGINKTSWFNSTSLDKNAKNIYLNAFKGCRVYTDFAKDAKQALDLSIRSCKKVNINLGVKSKSIDFWIIFLPYNLSALILGSTIPNGFFGKKLKKDIYTNIGTVPVFTPKVFLDKAAIIDDITEIYDGKKSLGTNGKGWIYGSNHFGYWFSQEKVRRKFLIWWLKRVYWSTLNNLLLNK